MSLRERKEEHASRDRGIDSLELISLIDLNVLSVLSFASKTRESLTKFPPRPRAP